VAKARVIKLDRAITSDAPLDPERAVKVLKLSDPRLKRVIESVGPFTLRPDLDLSPFEHLFKAIVFQQLTGKAAQTIYERVTTLLADERSLAEQLIEIPDSQLRSAGLSGAKASYLKDLATKSLAGVVPSNAVLLTMTDEEIIERLIAIKGIGRWSVEMLLMFHLGRPDVLPAADYGVRKGFALVYGLDELPTAKELAAHGSVWKPFRSIAAWYMWRALELPKKNGKIVYQRAK
jgi:DNA-3-methyladenine glycosylase II